MTPFQAGIRLSASMLFFREAHDWKCRDYQGVTVFELVFARGVTATRGTDGEREQVSKGLGEAKPG